MIWGILYFGAHVTLSVLQGRSYLFSFLWAPAEYVLKASLVIVTSSIRTVQILKKSHENHHSLQSNSKFYWIIFSSVLFIAVKTISFALIDERAFPS